MYANQNNVFNKIIEIRILENGSGKLLMKLVHLKQQLFSISRSLYYQLSVNE